MIRYAYAYNVVPEGDEVRFCFPAIDRIVSLIPRADAERMDMDEVRAFVQGAVLAALQLSMSLGEAIPTPDDPSTISADGFVYLNPQEAMKLELYRLYKANCSNVIDFARRIEKQETAARRLLNLRHRSWPQELEAAIAKLGKRIVHSWATEDVPQTSFLQTMLAPGDRQQRSAAAL